MTAIRKRDWFSVQRLFAHALEAGAVRRSFGTAEWDISGNCSDPFRTRYYARPPASKAGGKHVVVDRTRRAPLEVIMITRCHACEKCLRARTSLWQIRAAAEYRAARRTWFGTFTFRPSHRYAMLSEARRRAAAKGEDFDGFTDQRKSAELIKVVGAEVTKYLKRVRAASGVPLRYLWVSELHADGFPHFHALIFEVGEPIKHKLLASQWTLGFSKLKLAPDVQAVRYVCKYLSKSQSARVRASIGFGNAAKAVTSETQCVVLFQKGEQH